MRTLPRSILVLALCVLLTLTQSAAAQVRSAAQENTYNPEAEAYISERLLVDGNIDLAGVFATESERVVRAEFIVSLWQDQAFEELPLLKLSNATITGDIQAAGISIPYDVGFDHCSFDGRINLDSAFTQAFRIDNSTVAGSVRMGRINVDGDLALYNSVFEGEVSLFDASIARNLFASQSQFRGTVPDPDSSYPFELWKIYVGQSTEFTDAVIKGEAKADSAEFGVDVRFDGATFEKSASFQNMRVGDLASFQYATFMDVVTFESSLIDRDISFTGASFDGDANFDYLAVDRFFDFNEVTVNQAFSFLYPTVGWAYFADTTLEGPVFIEGIRVANDLDFTDAAYGYAAEPLSIYLASVDGQALFNGFAAPAGLNLSHNNFGSLEISALERTSFQQLSLDSTVVGGDLILDNIQIGNLSAAELEVQDKTTFSRLSVSDELNLSNASLGFLTIDEQGFWPPPTNRAPNSNLRGMTYNDIGFVQFDEPQTGSSADDTTTMAEKFRDKELGEDTWKVMLKMLEQSAYSPQAYHTLGQFLIEKGHPEWAADVEFSRQNRERREILVRGSGSWLWSWFNLLFSGYGQIPGLAIVWSLLVITIGAIFYWKESDLVILDDSETKPVYNPFLYSFALFVPFIELDIAEKWDPKPERKVAWIYKYVLKILGWILTPIALLTFGGVLQ